MSSQHDAPSNHGLFQRSLAAIILIVGLALAMPGTYLLIIGGSSYYLIAGAVMAVAGFLLWRGAQSGFVLFTLLYIGTLAWSVWEAGLNGWALLPRLDLITLFALLLLIAGARRSDALLSNKPLRIISGAAVTLFLALVLVILVPAVLPQQDNKLVTATGAKAVLPQADDSEWPHIGRTVGATRFSPLTQITPDNVSQLELAWKIHLGRPTKEIGGGLQATPLKIGNSLYTCNLHNVVIALDAENGETRWQFDPHTDKAGVVMAVCRGVTYYRTPGMEGLCSERIILTTYDARMIALDAQTGKHCPDFGNNGEVNLLEGMGEVAKGYYFLTSPATLVRDTLVVGGSVLDGQKTDEPSGVIRGYNVLSGEFSWAWDMGRPGEHGMPPPGEHFTRGTPNAWPPMSGDDELGLVYVPLGNPTPDYLTAHRTPEMFEFGSSIVAIDVETGARRWHFQTTHGDVWDYDNASPPTLVDFPTMEGLRPAVIQATKRGEFFVLDRRSGKPLVETVERAVPQGAVPGEKLSPTQPYPIGMPSFGGGRLSEEQMWGISPFDQLWCRIKFRQARYEGDFTPVGIRPTIVYPGNLGGSEWSGISVDPERHIMLLNVNYFPGYVRMVPRAQADLAGYRPFEAGVSPIDYVNWPQAGGAYATRLLPFMSPLQAPCIQPPFGEIAAVDLATRQIMWRKPLGTSRDSGPFDIPTLLPIPMGVPALGGTLVTRSGLVFIAATQERTFRAYDINSGEILWHTRLPAGGHANPMTYVSNQSGRQFVVIPASGAMTLRNGKADYLLAYALPKQ